MKKVITLFLSLFIFVIVHSQRVTPALAQRLEGKTTLEEIMKEVDAYYEGEGKEERFRKKRSGEFEDNYQMWKRWEWWMLSHLDENGKFVNVNKLNMQATEQVDMKWKNAVTEEGIVPYNRIGNESQLSTLRTDNAYGDWVNIGPVTDGTGPGNFKGLGRVDRIAFHPSNSNIIYLGTPAGGIWKTTNGGSSWSPISNSLPSLAVSGLVISPTNGNVVYMLSGDGDSHSAGYLVFDFGSSASSLGVFKTTDGGATWSKTGDLYTGTNDFVGHKLAISPTNGNYLMAATNQGLWRTTNGGTTWTQVRTGTYWDVEFKPNNDSVVYASTGSSILYSTDGGRSGTWNTATLSHSVASAGRIELAVSPNNSNYVYALCGNAGTGNFTGVFRSTNSGVDFTRRTNTPNILGSTKAGSDDGDQSGYDLCVTVHPDDANYLVTGGLIVWRTSSSNGGTTFQYYSVYRESDGTASEYIHPDVHEVAFNPLNNYLYAATDGGIYRSTDNGVSWTNLSAGVGVTQFYRFSMRDSDADGVMDGIGMIGGAQDNGIKYRNNSGTFFHTICCDGFGSAIAPDNANILYMNINDWFAKSTDGGATVFGLIDPVTFFSPIAIDYNNPDTVYIGGGQTRRSFNGFSSTNLSVATNTRRVLTTCPSNSARLYGSSGSNVVRSDDRISTWTTKSGTTGWPAGTFTVNDIKVYPTNSLEVYVCFGGYSNGNKVLRSLNGGDSWTNITDGLPNVPIYALAVSTEGIYAGSEIGVFFRGYGWSDWIPFYNGMPRLPVTGLAVNANNLVYASTFGRGMWFSSRRTACDDHLSITSSLDGPWYFQANKSISATLSANSGTGTEVFTHAGDSVMLKPGFEVTSGNFFKAYIAPCSSGGIPSSSKGIVHQMTVPRVREIAVEKQTSRLSPGAATLQNGEIYFNIPAKGKVQFLAKDAKSSWREFYPSEVFYPGVYSLKLPNAPVAEVKLLVDGKEMSNVPGK